MNNFSHLIKRCDHYLIIIPTCLSIIGTAGLASITRSNGTFLSREVIIQSAAFFLGIAAAAFLLMKGCRYFIDLEKPIYIISITLLLTVYIPGIGTSLYGSRSWLDLGFITFQPSEAVKITFIILMAACLSRTDRSSSIKPVLASAACGLPFIIIVAKEDFGTGCVYCAIWFLMIFCCGLDLRILSRLILSAVFLMPLLYFLMAGYQKDRVDAFLHPSDLDLPGNYQVWNSKVAIGSGGFWGKGYMDGTQSTLGFLPVPESDFIFAAITEETGFIGGLLIISLYGFFLYRILKTAKYAGELHGTLIAAGLAGMYFFQAFENIAMTMGLMPVTGITLPFLSCGGSSMVSSMMGTGLLLSISCSLKT